MLNLMLSVFILVFAQNAFASNPTLTSQQAGNYIGHLIDTLFDPSNHSGKYLKELKQVKENCIYQILENSGFYQSFFSVNKTYRTHEIYKAVLEFSQKYIESKSVEYAKQVINEADLPAGINKNTFVQKVVNKISDKIKKVLHQANINDGALTNYFGAPLYQKVAKIVKKGLRENTNPTFLTADCPICLERFINSRTQIILECGHNICSHCLKDWYYSKGESINCPLCRKPINIRNFSHLIWPPSAPAF